MLLEVVVVGLGDLLWLSWSGVFGSYGLGWAVAEGWVGGAGVGSEAWLLIRLGLGDSLTGLLIVPFGGTGLSTPAVSGLLLVLASSSVREALK